MRFVKIIKKNICLMACFVLMCGCLAGCGSSASEVNAESSSGELLIVTTIYPEYDWVMNVLGDNPAGAKVELLLDDGVDMHSYQPTVEDLMKISSADMFIYVGGESDEWVESAIDNMTGKDAVIINLMDVLGDKVFEEETVEGMQEEEEHGEEEHGEDEEELEYDEHVWLSLRNAEVITDAIAESMSVLDKDNADVYKSNADSYISKLDELDRKYSEAVAQADNKTLLFADRFPFRYMVSDYSLEYFAAFSGCSSETDATFETVIFLAKKVDELGLNAVLTIDGSGDDVARTVISNTSSKDQEILQLNSMQSVTSADIEGGMTYLSVMNENLEVIKEALK